MAISQELTREIEQELAALAKKDLRKPPMTIAKFLDEFGNNLGQAEKDNDPLVAAGFKNSRIPKYRAYFEMLSLAIGERIGAIADTPEKRAMFDEQMAIAEKDRKMMAVVASHIAEQSDDKKALHNYRVIAKGNSIIDTLTDILGLSALIKEYPQYASEIRPGGVAITGQFMDQAVERAVALLQMKGVVVEKGVPHNAAVDRQNRLLTLCIKAQADIRKFARAAFYDNSDYYNQNYASEARRQTSDDTVPDTVEQGQPASSI
jgi:hypothetical protein